MPLAGHVDEFNMLEPFFLEAVFKHRAGVAQVKILLPGHEHIAPLRLGHGGDLFMRNVARLKDLLLVQAHDVRVKIHAHESDGAGKHVRIRHAQHARHARSAGEAGDIDALVIDVVEIAHVVIRIHSHAHAGKDLAVVARIMRAHKDELLLRQHRLPLGRDGGRIARAHPDEEPMRHALFVLLRYDDVILLQAHVIGRRRLHRMHAHLDLRIVRNLRRLREGNQRAHAGLDVLGGVCGKTKRSHAGEDQKGAEHGPDQSGCSGGCRC